MQQECKLVLEHGDIVHRVRDGKRIDVGVSRPFQIRPQTVIARRPIDHDGTPCGPWMFQIGLDLYWLVGIDSWSSHPKPT